MKLSVMRMKWQKSRIKWQKNGTKIRLENVNSFLLLKWIIRMKMSVRNVPKNTGNLPSGLRIISG